MRHSRTRRRFTRLPHAAYAFFRRTVRLAAAVPGTQHRFRHRLHAAGRARPARTDLRAARHGAGPPGSRSAGAPVGRAHA
ncbi:hypothetical protein G6F57_023401 [Rhizopus arrhizus]|nr:hypothetical protein G6F24_018251 [Rhizopus arrhizus]KAG0947430.1 hypothetical protein G6F31_014190 [Rhizopus arrhizus]KAG1425130.1 hypothetical protein G6F57_023401 [Rhizopus arrhizus]